MLNYCSEVTRKKNKNIFNFFLLGFFCLVIFFGSVSNRIHVLDFFNNYKKKQKNKRDLRNANAIETFHEKNRIK